jgi:hypothetical protein
MPAHRGIVRRRGVADRQGRAGAGFAETSLCGETLSFPVDSPLMRTLLKELPGAAAVTDGKLTTQMNLVNVGNAQILTIPGEAMPNIGYYLKCKMRGEHNLLFGLTNDASATS